MHQDFRGKEKASSSNKMADEALALDTHKEKRA